MIEEGCLKKSNWGDASLQTCVVVSVNPRQRFRLGREAVIVGAAGSVSRSLYWDASTCVYGVCRSLGPSRLQTEEVCVRGPGLLVLLSRDPSQ
jgi:hypothetical protein